MNRRSGRPSAGLFLALVAALVAAPFLPAERAVADAATPDLTLTADTRYVVDPDKGAVHVAVALTAVNHLANTKTRTFYFDRAFLAVQPGTKNFSISARTGSPKVTVAAAKADHTLLRIDFGGRLAAGSSRTFTLSFDILDPGGPPTRETRIGTSLVSFSAWAFASESTPGGSVTVIFPPGYQVDVESSQLGEPTTDADGRTILASGRLAAPLTFFAYLVADRPSALVETTRQLAIDGRPLTLVMRAWPDDPAWAERVGGLLERGLPVLSEQIGLPWPADRRLVVEEAASRSSVGYSGRYDPTADRIEIAYYADSFVVLHEAAHVWFDGGLIAERWATEGFASWYATQAALALEEPVTGDPLTPELTAARFPLNAWAATNGADRTSDDYGYAASAELARLIAERAGPAGLTSVWRAARTGAGAYQPAGLRSSVATRPAGGLAGEDAVAVPIEAGLPPPDWRGLLDLLEERTGRDYRDLWRTWVVRDDEADLLRERAAARAQYAAVAERAGEWQLPPVVRQSLRAWQYEQSGELLAAADRALDDRELVRSAVAAAGLTMPRALEEAFEGSGGFAAAAAEADAQLLAVEAYGVAVAARPAAPGLFEELGLWGTTPGADLARAAAAFSLGQLQESVDASIAAHAAWSNAEEVGRNRLISMIAAALAALIAVGLVVSTLRATRRRARLIAQRARARQAHPIEAPAGAVSRGKER